MTASDHDSRAQSFRAFVKVAAKRLSLKPTDPLVLNAATVMLAQERLQIRLIEHDDVDPAELLRLSEHLTKILPPPLPPPVKIEVVEGNFQCCPACGHQAPCSEPPAKTVWPEALSKPARHVRVFLWLRLWLRLWQRPPSWLRAAPRVHGHLR